MSEKVAYTALRTALAGQGVRIDRIENLRVNGMPDVNVCINGNEIWIEIKAPTEPKRNTTALFGSAHKLSQEQKNWIKRQIDAGGQAYLLIKTDKRYMLVHGRWADSINERTVDDLLAVSVWHTPIPAKKDYWKKLKDLLWNN